MLTDEPDNDNDSDDTPQLSAEAMNALAEFYAELNSGADKVSIREDWQVRYLSTNSICLM